MHTRIECVVATQCCTQWKQSRTHKCRQRRNLWKSTQSLPLDNMHPSGAHVWRETNSLPMRGEAQARLVMDREDCLSTKKFNLNAPVNYAHWAVACSSKWERATAKRTSGKGDLRCRYGRCTHRAAKKLRPRNGGGQCRQSSGPKSANQVGIKPLSVSKQATDASKLWRAACTPQNGRIGFHPIRMQRQSENGKGRC